MDLFKRIPKEEPKMASFGQDTKMAGSKMDEALNQLQALVDADPDLTPQQRMAAGICITGLREAVAGFAILTEALRATAEATARIAAVLEDKRDDER